MKKFAALCLIVAFAVAAGPAMADHLVKLKKTDVAGMVTKVDAGKSFMVKDEAGAEKTLWLDPETKYMGKDGAEMAADSLKMDAKVKVSAAELEGKWIAAEIWFE